MDNSNETTQLNLDDNKNLMWGLKEEKKTSSLWLYM